MKKREKIKTALEDIAQKNNGKLTPDLVVEKAKSKRHPLHSYFEWDDRKAGHSFRLQQAAYLIREVKVNIEIPDNPNEVRNVRAFVNVRDSLPNGKINKSAKGYYVPTEYALSNEEYREQLLQSAKEDLEALRKKYQNLAELSGVMHEIGKFLSKTASRKKRKVANG